MLEAIIGNLVGDYILQNDWMASNKKNNSFICAIHCLVWTICVCVIGSWYNYYVFILLFLTHFTQDRTTIINWSMIKMGQTQFAGKPCAPWSSIIIDNIWHILTIMALWKMSHDWALL